MKFKRPKTWPDLLLDCSLTPGSTYSQSFLLIHGINLAPSAGLRPGSSAVMRLFIHVLWAWISYRLKEWDVREVTYTVNESGKLTQLLRV